MTCSPHSQPELASASSGHSSTSFEWERSNMPDFSDWLTVTQASTLTGAPAYSIRKAVRLNQIPAVTVATSYVMQREDILAWAKSRRGPGRPVGS